MLQRHEVLAGVLARTLGEPVGNKLIERLAVAELVDYSTYLTLVAACTSRRDGWGAPYYVRHVEQLAAAAAAPETGTLEVLHIDNTRRCTECGDQRGPFAGDGRCFPCYDAEVCEDEFVREVVQ